MIIKRDMTAAESNYLQCAVMIIVAGLLIVVIGGRDLFGWGSAACGILFFGGFFYLKHKEDQKAIEQATKTVRKDQPKDGYKVRYTTRKERKEREAAEAAKNKKSFPANKSESLKKK